MIVTVTLNPAVDKTLSASRIIMGSVNRMDEVQNIAGGKGINVAKVLKQYGYDVKTLGFLGGYYGKLVSDAIKDMGIEQNFTGVEGETRTSINVITEDGYVTEFLEPGPNITDDEVENFLNTYREEIKDAELVVLSGSAPKGVDTDIYAKLINIAKDLDKKVLLDSSSEYLKKGVYARPFMIKPNMRELETLMGRRIQGMQEVAEAAVQLVEWGIPHVMISMGSKGIFYACEGKDEVETYYVQAPTIRAVNTVGSGDSAVAAFAMGIINGEDAEMKIRHCVAISVANALGIENGILDKDKAEEIFDNLKLVIPAY